MTMQFDEKIQNEIDYVMDHFDFEKVHKVMTLLDWKWAGYDDELTIGDIRRFARGQIKDCLKCLFKYNEKEFTIECGGFVTNIYDSGDKIYISLRFSVTSWDNNYE